MGNIFIYELSLYHNSQLCLNIQGIRFACALFQRHLQQNSLILVCLYLRSIDSHIGPIYRDYF